jgi:hypothetical protein
VTGPVGQIGVKCKELKPRKMMSRNFEKEHSLIFMKEQFAEDKKQSSSSHIRLFSEVCSSYSQNKHKRAKG